MERAQYEEKQMNFKEEEEDVAKKWEPTIFTWVNRSRDPLYRLNSHQRRIDNYIKK